jgi:hypothetical protein
VRWSMTLLRIIDSSNRSETLHCLIALLRHITRSLDVLEIVLTRREVRSKPQQQPCRQLEDSLIISCLPIHARTHDLMAVVRLLHGESPRFQFHPQTTEQFHVQDDPNCFPVPGAKSNRTCRSTPPPPRSQPPPTHHHAALRASA